MTSSHLALGSCVIVLALASACSNTTTPPGDSGNGGLDTGAGNVDTGVAPNDTGVAPNDTGVAPPDTGGVVVDDSGIDGGSATADAGSDSGPTTFPDGAIMCRAGIECTNWSAAIAAAPRDASNTTMAGAVANCVVQVHRSDCCGAMRAYGVNHGGRTALCTAETMCRAMYPATPGCSSDVITVDGGGTTTNMSLVRVRGVPTTPCSAGACVRCETIICDPTDATCLSLEGITATQCG
jgi:hypothetical protein